MNVLWITNIVFPEAMAKLLGPSELKSSGGWMLAAANALTKRDEIKLYVASVSSIVSSLTRIEGDSITYYIIPLGAGNLKENNEYQQHWRSINDEIHPDIVHIHGTEFSHGYEYMKVCGVDNVVISIQGLKSEISEYYLAGLSKWEVYKNLTIRDFIKGSILREQREFRRSSKYETKMLQMAKHIIGRTSWDKIHSQSVNPDVKYFFCNESLREEFYDGALWNIRNCHRYTIFLSQAGYPIKGLHQVLKAMPFILRKYPTTKIRIAGTDITQSSSLNNLIRLRGYGLYLKRLMARLGLLEKVSFLGDLNAEEMKQEYMSCNVFICPSSIENSPNSLSEAQILGVPCVASYVGGIPDMMTGDEENLYRFEDIQMLASKICQIFENENLQTYHMSKVAKARHDYEFNTTNLLNIYKNIVKEC